MRYSKLKIQIISVISILVLNMTLISCANNESKNENLNQNNETSTQKYIPEIDVSFAKGIDEDFEANVLPKTPNETLENNRWTKLYKEELGINIKYEWTVRGNEDSDAYTKKMNVAIASEEIPDIVNVNAYQLKKLVDSNMVTDLTDYWNSYASDMLKDFYTRQGEAALNTSTYDGKLMAIGTLPDTYVSGTFIWIRTDWMKKLNIKEPKTMDDVINICAQFTYNDPDGNGKNDTYGLAVVSDLYYPFSGLEGFFAGFHAYPNIWIENEAGNLVYGSLQPEVKETLEVLAEMYATEQIDPEFALKDSSKVGDNIINGEIGLEFGEQWNPMFPLVTNYLNNPNADWKAFPLVSVDEQEVYSPCKFNITRFLAVRKDYENPEALIKLKNLFVEMCWGESGDFNKYYMPIENQSVGVWKFSPVIPSPPLKNVAALRQINKAREENTLDELEGEAAAIQRNIEAFKNGDKTQWGWEKIYGVDGALNIGIDYIDNDKRYKDRFFGAPTETMVKKKMALYKMEKEIFIKIIMGQEPIDRFDQFVNDWYEIGGAQITSEVNAWHDSIN